MTASAQPEPMTLAEMRARKRAADERQAAAARRHQESRIDAATLAAQAAELAREQERRRQEQQERQAVEAARIAAESERLRADALIAAEQHQAALQARSHKIEAAPKGMVCRIARRHGLTRADLTGPSRLRTIVRVRMLAMAVLARRFPDMSLKQIGRHFGGRDHTTVLHALRKMNGPGYSHRANTKRGSQL